MCILKMTLHYVEQSPYLLRYDKKSLKISQSFKLANIFRDNKNIFVKRHRHFVLEQNLFFLYKDIRAWRHIAQKR